MPLSWYVPSQIIPKSRVVHLADKQILKRHILSYPKIIVSKNPPRGVGGWVVVVGGVRYLAHGLRLINAPKTSHDTSTKTRVAYGNSHLACEEIKGT